MNESEVTHKEQQLAAAARQELERSSATLDTFTLARLRAARLRALQSASSSPALLGWRSAIAASVALALLAGVLLWQVPAPSPNGNTALEMLSAVDEGYDLYENLEFYEWLEAQSDEEQG